MSDKPEVVVMDGVEIDVPKADQFTIYPNQFLTLQRPTFQFDGRTFYAPWGGDYTALLVGFDLAYRARRGDESAVAVLTAFNATVEDADGQPYWPVKTP